MSETPNVPTAGKPKKSVALSGVVAGNTALCTVGRTGNDLHYRGYDILDIADKCEFEEIAYLLVHKKLPTKAELAAYKKKLAGMRELPPQVKAALEQLPDTPENRAFREKVRPAVERYNGIGVRIEDSFLLTETELIRLSAKVPRTLEEIDEFMRSRR